MYAPEPDWEREQTDHEEVMDMLYPERAESRKKPNAGAGDDGWGFGG